MKQLVFLFLLIPVIVGATPKIYFDYKVYYTLDHQPYVETMLQFSASSLKFIANQNGNLESKLEVTQIFKIKDSIILVDKYIVQSPEMLDSTVEDYYDVKRVLLKPNVYDLELIIKDLNNNQVVEGVVQIVVEKFDSEKINFSSVELIQSASKTTEKNEFVKNGYFILPYLTNYFPPQNDKIATYFEIYNAQKILGENQKYLITYQIEDYLTGNKIENIFKVQKLTTARVNPIIAFLPIDKLPSGDYNLVITLIDNTNKEKKQEKIFFQRRNDIEELSQISVENLDISNSFTNDIVFDSIPFYLNSLLPITQGYDRATILSLIKSKDTTAMQKYFHAFWVKTDKVNPFYAWVKYKEQVMYCEKEFSTQIKHGFETDRGRVYLRYGAPNYITDRPSEPSAYPYQIWHYYKVGNFNNIRFVFYNPDLITNDYPMLHSDLRGELQNYRWQRDLHKRDSPNVNIDDPNDGNYDHYGGQSGIYFNN
ncbi:MAG TPA: GWxTD domain-containing protein [Crocinitomix sp.]|nr:GWxTD domain-containing protein [Crocinitomix sp.]